MAVHRYKANESGSSEEVVESPKEVLKKITKPATKKSAKTEKPKKERKALKVFAPFRAIGSYIAGSWRELKAVRWPNRKQTWALTLAVILFSLALGVLIFLLDAGFTYLFKKVIF